MIYWVLKKEGEHKPKTEKQLPVWNRKVKKALIDRNLTIKELAEIVGYSTVYVTNIVNGKIVNATRAEEKINDALGLN